MCSVVASFFAVGTVRRLSFVARGRPALRLVYGLPTSLPRGVAKVAPRLSLCGTHPPAPHITGQNTMRYTRSTTRFSTIMISGGLLSGLVGLGLLGSCGSDDSETELGDDKGGDNCGDGESGG